MGPRLKCDHCGWSGAPYDALTHPRLGDAVCPECWDEGYEARPREMLGGLMEAVLADDLAAGAGPRERKSMIDWTDEDWEVARRTERARLAHESSRVLLKTRIKGARQLGFGFMRDEFRVAPRKAKGKGKRR